VGAETSFSYAQDKLTRRLVALLMDWLSVAEEGMKKIISTQIKLWLSCLIFINDSFEKFTSSLFFHFMIVPYQPHSVMTMFL